MKNIIGFIVLVVICVGLGVALIAVKKQATDQQAIDAKTIGTFSNNLASTTKDLEDKSNVVVELQKDLSTEKKALDDLTNNFAQVSGTLAKTQTSLDQTQASLEDSKKEVAKRDAKITELETENQALDRRANELTTAITNLTLEIAETQRKLTSSEGDRAFLSGELKRMMADKAELERQFNDVTIVKAQVAKLKEQMVLARRLEWTRMGVYAASEQKGAQRLMQGAHASTPKVAEKPNYDLNVEVRSDGTVRNVTPLPTPSK